MKFVQTKSLLAAAALASTALVAAPAAAKSIEITITSNQQVGGLFLTPLLTVLHDGSYDAFDPGSAASTGVETLAETGSPAAEIGGAAAGFTTNVITSPGGFAGAPVIDPGESATIRIDNIDVTSDRYLTFLSMIIPSNDLFVGNGNPFAYELFDDMGNFTNISPIEITADEVWDAGTEANDNQGAAFNSAGGTETETDRCLPWHWVVWDTCVANKKRPDPGDLAKGARCVGPGRPLVILRRPCCGRPASV